jgi:hypothetical protein
MGIDPKSPTAYMDTRTKKIYYPASWFKSEFYTGVLGIDKDMAVHAAIAIHNGAQIHESLHVLKSGDLNVEKRTVVRLLNLKEDAWKVLDDKIKMFHACVNIIEDIYIENFGLIHYPYNMTFMHYTYYCFFPEH